MSTDNSMTRNIYSNISLENGHSRVLILKVESIEQLSALITGYSDGEFIIYEPNLHEYNVSARAVSNIRNSDNVRLISNIRELDQDYESFDAVILEPLRYMSHSLVENQIKTSFSFLKHEGLFYFIINKKIGGESHKRILKSTAFGEGIGLVKGKQGREIVIIRKSSDQGGKALTTSFQDTIQFTIHNLSLSFQTEASLFSREKLDEGTRLLLESINLLSFNRLLDVGCGWGAIGCVAAKINNEGTVVMMDIDTRATNVALDNVLRLGLQQRVSVVATDNINTIEGKFDLILSNPPFHAPQEIIVSLFEGVKNKLSEDGRFYAVIEKSYTPKFSKALQSCFRHYTVHNEMQNSNYIILSANLNSV